MATAISQVQRPIVSFTGIRELLDDVTSPNAITDSAALLARLNALFEGQIVSFQAHTPEPEYTQYRVNPQLIEVQSGWTEEDWMMTTRAWSLDVPLMHFREVDFSVWYVRNTAAPAGRRVRNQSHGGVLSSFAKDLAYTCTAEVHVPIAEMSSDREPAQNVWSLTLKPITYTQFGAGNVKVLERDIPNNVFKLHGVDKYAGLSAHLAS